MSLNFDSSNYVEYGSAHPLIDALTEWTAMVWLFVTDDPAGVFYTAIGDDSLTAAGSLGHLFWFDGRSANDRFLASCNNGDVAGADISYGNGSVVNGQWACLLSTWKQNDNHRAYKGGVETADSPKATANSAWDVSASIFTVGRRPDRTDGLLRDGDFVAESAYWHRILSAEEITALAAGASPLFFPDLKWYCPYRDVNDLTDWIGGNAGTENGAGALSTGEHPPIILPGQFTNFFVPAAAAGKPGAGSLGMMGVGW